MATDTITQQTVDVVTPSAGESVTEGTILEWHVKVGDEIKVDATIVEISTDKVDVELPSPASGTVTEILVAEGDTVTVGQVIARIALGGGASAGPTTPTDSAPQKAPAQQSDGSSRAATSAPSASPAEQSDGASNGRRPRARTSAALERAGDRRLDAGCGRVGQRGDDPRMACRGRWTDQGRRHDRRDLHRQGRSGASLAGERHGHRDPRRRGRHGHCRTGDRPDRGRRRAPSRRPTRPPAYRAAATQAPSAAGVPEGTKVSPVAARAAAVEGVDLAQVSGSGPAGRITKSDVLSASGNGASANGAATEPGARRASG